MLEAIRKGYYKADPKVIAELTKFYAESVAKHGLSSGLVSGGNNQLQKYVEKRLGAPGLTALAANYKKAIQKSENTGKSKKVTGQKVSEKEKNKTQKEDKSEQDNRNAPNTNWQLIMICSVIGLFVFGVFRKSRVK